MKPLEKNKLIKTFSVFYSERKMLTKVRVAGLISFQASREVATSKWNHENPLRVNARILWNRKRKLFNPKWPEEIELNSEKSVALNSEIDCISKRKKIFLGPCHKIETILKCCKTRRKSFLDISKSPYSNLAPYFLLTQS